MTAREYYQALLASLDAFPFVIASELHFREIDRHECYVRGRLELTHGMELHVAEYVLTEPSPRRPKYRYHLQLADGRLIKRWDNVPHYPDLPTFPHHRHEADGRVEASPAMDIPQVLHTVISLLSSE